MNGCGVRKRGFTIVEVLVVLGVLGLLLGLLLPALSGAQKKGRKVREINALRQVGIAWGLYANASNDRVLPGYLEPEIQERWNVTFEFPNRKAVGEEAAAPWPWRLMPYLDFNHEMIHGYREEPQRDIVNLDEEEFQIAMEPGFGYNAYYLGGWWWLDNNNIPRYRFYDADVNGARKALVVTSMGRIRRSTELVVFCSSSRLKPGLYRKWSNKLPGWHYVTPPRLGTTPQWTLPDLSAESGSGSASIVARPTLRSNAPTRSYDSGSVRVETLTGAPIGRYNGLAAVLFADGHTDAQRPGALYDPRKWIDAADSADFRHSGVVP